MALSYSDDRFKSLKTKKIKFNILRGVIVTAAIFSIFYAYSILPLADVYAIAFSSPLFIAAFSILFLKETVCWKHWVAIIVGFIGVLIMLEPDAGIVSYAGLSPLLAALLMAAATILVRNIGKTESSVTIAFYSTIVGIVISSIMLIAGYLQGEAAPHYLKFIMPHGIDLVFIIMIGILGGLADIFIFAGYRTTNNTSVLAPFQYSQMIWGILFGIIFFSDWPDEQLFLGGGIVILSGFYIVGREFLEKKKAKQKAQ